jgi:pyrroloquinoline quinone biosynthesis protein E
MVHKPLGLLAELTHRCPLGCPYCSNPLALDARADELDTTTWLRVFREAAQLGVLQVHLSGGEPARGAISSTSPPVPMRPTFTPI